MYNKENHKVYLLTSFILVVLLVIVANQNDILKKQVAPSSKTIFNISQKKAWIEAAVISEEPVEIKAQGDKNAKTIGYVQNMESVLLLINTKSTYLGWYHIESGNGIVGFIPSKNIHIDFLEAKKKSIHWIDQKTTSISTSPDFLNINQIQSIYDYTRYLATIPEQNIFLYTIYKGTLSETLYQKEWLWNSGMSLNIDGMDIIFEDWTTPLRSDEIDIKLFQNNQYMAINYVDGIGTGLHHEALHIIDMKNGFKEIVIQDPLEITKQNLKQHATSEGINISIGHENIEIKIPEPDKHVIDNIGNVIFYTVTDDNISADVYLSPYLSSFLFIGALHINYVLKDNQFVPENIFFVDKDQLEHYNDL